MRYFFEIAYNGKNYAGWQSQANATGIQSMLEDALTKIFRVPLKIVGSGRTDAGVHCEQQFFHADIDSSFQHDDLKNKMNSFLPRDIAVLSIYPVRKDAHARYSATERSYEYRLTLRKDPFLEGYAFHYHKSADIKTMNRAAALLTGTHDFACFSKVKTDVNHFLCEVKKARWTQKGELLIFNITANRFLRGMVRAIVGTLLDVGSGKISIKDFQKIINSKDRRKAGANVVPYGLYLKSVKYPASVFVKNKSK